MANPMVVVTLARRSTGIPSSFQPARAGSNALRYETGFRCVPQSTLSPASSRNERAGSLTGIKLLGFDPGVGDQLAPLLAFASDEFCESLGRTLPSVPDLFSMMMVWHSVSDTTGRNARITMSALPPGGNVTMILIGRSGYAFAVSTANDDNRASAAAPTRARRRDGNIGDGNIQGLR